MRLTKKTLLLAGVSAGALMMNSGAVVAQEASSSFVIEEVIVTASKREERVLDVPIAITAYTSEFADRVNIDDIKNLVKFTPGMAGDSQDSFVDFINVRGISTNDFGNGGDPSTGFFKNGLYQGRTGSATTSIYDIDRAEVLRGPQGFLFGRNAIAGAISIHTARPDFETPMIKLEGGFGARGIIEGEAVINFPYSDNFAIRLAGYTSHEDGYITNTVFPDAAPLYGHDKTAGRFSAALRRDNWDVFFVAEYEDKTGSGTAYRAVDIDGAFGLLTTITGVNVAPGSDLRTISSNLTLGNDDHAEIISVMGEVNIEFDFATFTSLTGYKDHNYQYAEDYDGMPITFFDYSQDQTGDYFEQELRLVSSTDGPLSWYVGGSYFKENIDTTFLNRANEDVLCGAYYYDYYGTSTCEELYDYWGYPGFMTTEEGLLEGNRIVGSYHGWGAYLDLTYDISDQFDFGFGIRYTTNTKDFGIDIFPVTSELGPWYNYGAISDGFINGSGHWTDLSPRFIARYRPDDDIMMYASVTKGWKSGGFNSFGFNGVIGDDLVILPGATPDAYEPEVVWSYEAGIKGTMSDNTIRYDFSVYRYIYTDLQLNFFDAGTKVDNVGRVESWGAEASILAALTENIDILLSGAYNQNSISEAEFIEPTSTGNRLPGAPEYKVAGLLSYHTRITDTAELNASVDFVAQTSVFSSGLANQPEGVLNGYEDVSVRIGYEHDAGWAVTLYIENLFDSIYWDGGYESAYPLPVVRFGVSRPRTFGARFYYNWGG